MTSLCHTTDRKGNSFGRIIYLLGWGGGGGGGGGGAQCAYP